MSEKLKCCYCTPPCLELFITLFQSLCKLADFTANIYSQFSVIGFITLVTIIWQWLSKVIAIHMTLTGIEKYISNLIAEFGCPRNRYSQISVTNVATQHCQKLNSVQSKHLQCIICAKSINFGNIISDYCYCILLQFWNFFKTLSMLNLK